MFLSGSDAAKGASALPVAPLVKRVLLSLNVCVEFAVHHKIDFNTHEFFDVLFHRSLTKSFEPVLQ